MKIVLEFSAEDFKANRAKTLEELLGGGADKKSVKKTRKEEPEEDEDEEEDTDDTEEDEDTDDEDTDEVDIDILRETVQAAVKAGNKLKLEALFKKYKVKALSGLKESQYTKFHTELKPLTKKKK